MYLSSLVVLIGGLLLAGALANAGLLKPVTVALLLFLACWFDFPPVVPVAFATEKHLFLRTLFGVRRYPRPMVGVFDWTTRRVLTIHCPGHRRTYYRFSDTMLGANGFGWSHARLVKMLTASGLTARAPEERSPLGPPTAP